MSISKTDPIRNWLMRNPRPAFVVLEVNGEPLEIEVAQAPDRPNWKAIAETIVNQGAEKVTLFDAKRKLLRSDNIDNSPESASKEIEMPSVLADDPQAAAFMLYARLLQQHQRETVLVAFEKMADVLDRVVGQLEVMTMRAREAEDDLFNAEAERLEAERERIEQEKESGDTKEQILTAIVSGANAKKAKPNGAVS